MDSNPNYTFFINIRNQIQFNNLLTVAKYFISKLNRNLVTLILEY
jgi:hypothetical protein